MKTKLLFAGALALIMAGCSQDEMLVGAPSGEAANGVTFEASISGGAETKAYWASGTYDWTWIAEQDKIMVIYDGTTDVAGPNSPADVTGSWKGKNATSGYIYRASASGGTGYFVADNAADDLLSLKQPKTSDAVAPKFRAFWPSNVTISGGKITLPDLRGEKVDENWVQKQDTENGKSIANKYGFMYSESTSNAEYDNVNGDNAISKNRFNLSFEGISPLMVFKVKASSDDTGVNREYKRDYANKIIANLGGLVSVDFEASETAESQETKANYLTYGSNATWNVGATALSDGFEIGKTDLVKKVTTQFDTPQTGAEATAFMMIANIDRSKLRTEGETERMTATYNFGAASYSTYLDRNDDWIGNTLIKFPKAAGWSLDEQPYILYPTAANETTYVLQLNKSFSGTLKDIFDTAGATDIKDAGGNAINKTSITEFVSKVAIDESDFTTIQTLGVNNNTSTVTAVTLLENTSIPAKAFEGMSKLTYLNLPKVTTVANENAFPSNAEYTEVYMGSYNFADVAGDQVPGKVRDILLNAENLVKADVSGVESIGKAFPSSGVSFQNFQALQEITVEKGVQIGGNGFENCVALTSVKFPEGDEDGYVTLVDGTNSQFLGCKTLTGIAISNEKIQNQAFKNCTALASIVGEWKDIDTENKVVNIVPTEIGVSAFEGCEALVDIDLRNVATMGKAAFKGCIALAGNGKWSPNGKTVLYLDNLTYVPDEAFNGCNAIEHIAFENATQIGVRILSSLKYGKLKQIDFKKPFTVHSSEVTTDQTVYFGNLGTLAVFCSKSQEGVGNNTLTLKGDAEGSEAKTLNIKGGVFNIY